MKSVFSIFGFMVLFGFSVAQADPVIPCEDNFYDLQRDEVLSFDASLATFIQSSLQTDNSVLIEAFDDQGSLIGSELRSIPITKCRN